jgi:molecular chaperone DnaK
MVYSAEKTLRDLGDKVPGNVKADVETRIKAVRDALSGSDIAHIQRSADELASAVQQIGASMYEQPGAGPGTSGPSGETGEQRPPESDVVDGDFKEA